jgi:anti-anti-sigma regulatory factor
MLSLHRRPLESRSVQGAEVLTITRPQLLDPGCVGHVCRLIRKAIRRTGALRVILDWQHVKFVSEAVTAPLRELQRFLTGRGGQLLLSGLRPRVAHAFRLTGLIGWGGGQAGLLEIAPDVPAGPEGQKSATRRFEQVRAG